jgi:hypothetical protein
MLRGTFGPKREGGNRRMEKIRSFVSPNIVKIIKLTRRRSAMEERNVPPSSGSMYL